MILKDDYYVKTEKLLQLADEIGFSHSAALDMDSLVFRQEVRDMCSADLCRSYGKSWSCPPAVGSLERIAERTAKYDSGIVVQTSGDLENNFDMESIRRIMADHKKKFDTFIRQVRLLTKECLPMGAGACTVCHRCTYPDRPCRHPDKMLVSMEAYGLLVSDVCLKSGLEYNYGQNTMTYTSCVLVKTKGEGK